jgi:hypothetical protein
VVRRDEHEDETITQARYETATEPSQNNIECFH